MKKILFLLFIIFFVSASKTFAIENPHKNPNNKIGIHILFDHELEKASELVNSNGGRWGYITIPIQNSDRDLIKWQLFMDRAKKHEVIPIIRLATEGDYFNTHVWKKPTPEDVVDYANFLDSLNWPTKNRYVIIYNETNRADEWGGQVNPGEYASILSFAVNVFKSKSDDFFIIGGGLDNAAPDSLPQYMDQYTFLKRMQEAVPGIFNQIDGYASHSYPNPGFMQPPDVITRKSISSFIFERNLIREFVNDKDIPIFITETGWNAPHITDQMKANYYKEAFASVWSDPAIVAVTPFLLHAGEGPFTGFSFINKKGTPTLQMQALMKIPKVEGKPSLSPYILGLEKLLTSDYPQKDFRDSLKSDSSLSISILAQDTFKWVMRL